MLVLSQSESVGGRCTCQDVYGPQLPRVSPLVLIGTTSFDHGSRDCRKRIPSNNLHNNPPPTPYLCPRCHATTSQSRNFGLLQRSCSTFWLSRALPRVFIFLTTTSRAYPVLNIQKQIRLDNLPPFERSPWFEMAVRRQRTTSRSATLLLRRSHSPRSATNGETCWPKSSQR